MSETQSGKGLEYRSVNVPTQSSLFRFRRKAYGTKGYENKLLEKGTNTTYLIHCSGIKENPVFTGGVGRVFT